jgi:uncharacterized protein YukE
MSFEGMDVDQLQGLAKRIDSDAQALYNLMTNLNGVIGGLTFLWNGPVAATFEQDWESRNRPAILAAYNTLTNLHTHLVNNINQQSSASAADGGGWTAERVVGDFENTLTALGLVGMPVSMFSGTSKILGVTDTGLTGVGYIGTAIDSYHAEQDEYQFDTNLAAGQYGKAANNLVLGMSDELKAVSGPAAEKDPLVGAALYGAGVDLKLADEVANLDWKDTPSPFSGSNFEQDYVPVLQSMGTGAYWEQAGKTLWGAL